MSLILLDTTVLIDSDRHGGPLFDGLDDDVDPAVSAITLAELLLGVELSKGKRREARLGFVQMVVATTAIIPYDSAVAIEHPALLAAVRQSGRPRGAHDLIVAATALATGRTVVTSDIRAFQDLPGVSVRAPEGPV